MLTSAIHTLGFITLAMDFSYSRKMDLTTSFGFLLAVAAASKPQYEHRCYRTMQTIFQPVSKQR